jgi:hypothetical protein
MVFGCCSLLVRTVCNVRKLLRDLGRILLTCTILNAPGAAKFLLNWPTTDINITTGSGASFLARVRLTVKFFARVFGPLVYGTISLSTLLYSTLLYSTLLYSTLLYSTLLYSTLLYSTRERERVVRYISL